MSNRKHLLDAITSRKETTAEDDQTNNQKNDSTPNLSDTPAPNSAEISSPNISETPTPNHSSSLQTSSDVSAPNSSDTPVPNPSDTPLPNTSNTSGTKSLEAPTANQPPTTELQTTEGDTNSLSQMSIQDIVAYFVAQIEHAEEKQKPLAFVKQSEQKWVEQHPLLSTNVRTEYHEIIDRLTAHYHLKKYEVVERLLYNGIKYGLKSSQFHD